MQKESGCAPKITSWQCLKKSWYSDAVAVLQFSHANPKNKSRN